ncbi:hypothetical protein LOK49_LG03G03488 [Camellia lanceoleosa]|uniref:Uncharacterized protein n=1 Tax=Camellia lanceoleosa TaxID=1840588 RepID=A0ACC0IJC2_9ERIC|nr:hypothetical protein LOK49_LG03G03488 [Camellia lanceoleosa]
MLRSAPPSTATARHRRHLFSTLQCCWTDLKYKPNYDEPAMLQFCVRNHCLVLQLYHLDSIPQCLKDFLGDPEICFVGNGGLRSGLSDLNSHYEIECKSGIEVSELAAKILKKPNLLGVGLARLADEVGIPRVESPSLGSFDWGAKVFSDEQIKYAIQDVYACSLIGSMLLGML